MSRWLSVSLVLLVCLFAFLPLSAQVASPDFTFVLLPDTQNEAEFFPSVLDSQTQWIVDNQARLNIQAVLGLGDIVNDGASPTQQGNADAAIKLLDTAGIPYFLSIGNHDYDGGDDGVTARAVTGFNQWFGPARYAAKSYYKGNFPAASNENFYGVLTINGQQYLILVVEYIPRSSSLDWAASIVKANPDKEVIVVTHSYLFVDGTTADRCDTEDRPRKDNDGEQMWENFVSKYPNIIMVVNGHLTAGQGAHHSELGVNGNLVNAMFSNYQLLSNGGDGWLRIVTVHPSSNTIDVQTYSPFLNSYMTDSDNQFTLNYHNPGFHTGFGKITGRVTGSGCQKITGAVVSAGAVSGTVDATGRFSLQVAPGTYNVSASAATWQSGTRSVQVNDGYSSDINFYLTNPPPCTLQGVARSVTICTPANGTAVTSPVHLVAATSEPVMRMEVWVDGNKFGSAPGNVVDTNVPLASGQHNVQVAAVEVDTSVFSGAVTFTINPPPSPPIPSDFTVSASPASQSVKQGQAATFGVSVAAQNGAFTNAVALSCSGLPQGMTCSFSPNAVTPGATAARATLTLSTGASSAGVVTTRQPFVKSFAVAYALLLPFAGIILECGRRSKLNPRVGILCLLLIAGIALQACGGGGASQLVSSQSGASAAPPSSGGGTPTPVPAPAPTPITSSVTIVATSGAIAHSTSVSVTLQ
jgi:hypothetical protein